jgi:2-iminoacetate synthase ThiH
MTKGRPGVLDPLRLVPRGGPAICNVSITNVCNATCGFCNFAHDKGFVTHRKWLDADRFAAALSLLRERAGVRFLTFMGASRCCIRAS